MSKQLKRYRVSVAVEVDAPSAESAKSVVVSRIGFPTPGQRSSVRLFWQQQILPWHRTVLAVDELDQDGDPMIRARIGQPIPAGSVGRR